MTPRKAKNWHPETKFVLSVIAVKSNVSIKGKYVKFSESKLPLNISNLLANINEQ